MIIIIIIIIFIIFIIIIIIIINTVVIIIILDWFEEWNRVASLGWGVSASLLWDCQALWNLKVDPDYVITTLNAQKVCRSRKRF